MRIVQVHNYYQQAGGEDTVVKVEHDLLVSGGHDVMVYTKNNDSLVGLPKLLVAAFKSLWNPTTYREFRALLRKTRPDVVHCHNIFPVISPSVYWACAREDVPVVQTLHNYRLLCANALLFRSHGLRRLESGRVCELCVSKRFKWPGVRYGCYRGSRTGSLVVTLMLFLHRLLGTWTERVDLYIALTEFQKSKLVAGGLPEKKICVKPNFLRDSAAPVQSEEGEVADVLDTLDVPKETPFALFVGRLSEEKGCSLMIRAWGLVEGRHARAAAKETERPRPEPRPRLLIVGDGPERSALERLCAASGCRDSVFFLGRQPNQSVRLLMGKALFLIFPSIWYEGYPMTIAESFSRGCAVIAANDGSMQEIVADKKTGLRFKMGDVEDLASSIEWALHHPAEVSQFGANAQRFARNRYTETRNLEAIEAIYELAIGGQSST